MKDKYLNFAALADAEPDSFSITALDRGSDVCVIAPHGGKIEAQSKIGQGTRFTVTLPA